MMVVVEAVQREASGKMPRYVQPRLLLWAHWTSPCKLGPPGRAPIVGAFNYQLLAFGFPPDVAWLSFQQGSCTIRRISFGPMSLTSEYMV